MRLPRLACLFLIAGCSFDATVPAGVVITCGSDADCPKGLRCRGSTLTCQPAGFDDVPPAIVDGSLQLSFVASPQSLQPSPTQLGPLSEARLAFRATEPLGRTPIISSTPGLSCFARSASLDAFEFGCVLPAGFTGPDGAAQLEARLEDEAGNTATVPLAVTLVIDTQAPPPPHTEVPDAVVLIRAPWGSAATLFAPQDAMACAVGAVEQADALVVRSGTLERGLLHVASDGSVARAPLTRLDTPDVEVAAVDSAGNASSFTRVHDGRWVATFPREGAVGSGNPHHLGGTAVVGLTPVSEGLPARTLPSAPVLGGSAWRQVGGPLPVSQGRPTLSFDASRGRTVRFGGVQTRLVFVELTGNWEVLGPPLGLPDVIEAAGTGWVTRPSSDPESDGSPPGRVGAVSATNALEGLTYLQGGNGPNPTPIAGDPTAGPLLKDTWAWNGTSWLRLPDGPEVRGATAWVDEQRGSFIVAGGEGDAGARDTLWALEQGSWRQLDFTLPQPVSWAAAARDEAAQATWLFGGRLADGGLSRELWVVRDGGTERVEPDGGPWPAARVAAAGASRPGAQLVLVGGLGSDGGALLDSWTWAQGAWRQGSALPADAGAEPPVLAWDGTRQTMLLLVGQHSFERDANDSSAWVDRTASSPPAPGWHPPLACAEPLGGCVTFGQGPFAAYRLGPTGWTPAADLATGQPPLRWIQQLHAAWDSEHGSLLAIAPGFGAAVLRPDAGWATAPSPPVGFGSGSHLAEVPGGLLFVTTTKQGPLYWPYNPSGEFFGWNGTSWARAGVLDASRVPNGAGLELNWTHVVQAPASPTQVFGLQLTKALGTNLCGAPFQCWIPGPAPSFNQRWQSAGDGGWPSQGDLTGLAAISAVAPAPLRGEAVSFAGMTSGSTNPSSLLFAITRAGSVPMTLATVDGFGTPVGRVGTALAWDPISLRHVAFGGGRSVEDWGFWQTNSGHINQGDLINGCGVLWFTNYACSETVLLGALPQPDLDDVWLLSRAEERPGVLGQLDLQAALLPPNAPITKLTVRSRSAGVGVQDAKSQSPASGVRAQWWSDGRWQTVAENTAGSTPSALEGQAPVNRPLRQLGSGGPTLHVRLESVGVNGPGTASLTASEFEVELSYRLP